MSVLMSHVAECCRQIYLCDKLSSTLVFTLREREKEYVQYVRVCVCQLGGRTDRYHCSLTKTMDGSPQYRCMAGAEAASYQGGRGQCLTPAYVVRVGLGV